MMKVEELNRSQLTELKCQYLADLLEEADEPFYMSYMADIDSIVSDLEIFEAYEDYYFVEDDFSCTAA